MALREWVVCPTLHDWSSFLAASDLPGDRAPASRFDPTSAALLECFCLPEALSLKVGCILLPPFAACGVQVEGCSKRACFSFGKEWATTLCADHRQVSYGRVGSSCFRFLVSTPGRRGWGRQTLVAGLGCFSASLLDKSPGRMNISAGASLVPSL